MLTRKQIDDLPRQSKLLRNKQAVLHVYAGKGKREVVYLVTFDLSEAQRALDDLTDKGFRGYMSLVEIDNRVENALEWLVWKDGGPIPSYLVRWLV